METLQLYFGLLKNHSVCWTCKEGKGGQGLIQHLLDQHESELDLPSDSLGSDYENQKFLRKLMPENRIISNLP